MVADFWQPGPALTAVCETETVASCGGLPNCSFDAQPPFVHWTIANVSQLEWRLAPEAHSGPYSAEAAFLQNPGYGELTSAAVEINGGSCYEFSLYGKSTASGDLGVIVRVQWYDDAQQLIATNEIGIINYSIPDWLMYSGVVSSPDNAVTASVTLWAGGTSLTAETAVPAEFGSVFIDDIHAQEAPSPCSSSPEP